MKSMTKKLTILLVVALLLATMCVLAACSPKKAALGEEEKGEDGKFTVVVLLPDGTPAEGCGVQMCEVNADGNEGACHIVATNKDGIAILVADEENLADLNCKVCNLHFNDDAMINGYKMPEKFGHLQIHLGKKITVQLEKA